MANTNIFTGQILQIPADKSTETYVVQAGDNLFRIALRFNKTVEEIKNTNKIDNDTIDIGQKLSIPINNTSAQVIPTANQELREPPANNNSLSGSETTVKGTDNQQSSKQVISRNMITENDKKLLARLIYAEARGESIEGQMAVGAVIINRLKNSQFPKCIKDIIYEKRGNVYQFTPVENGSINMEPDTTAFNAANEALKGNDPTHGSLFFYNPDITDDQWIRTLPEKRRIGNHIFAR